MARSLPNPPRDEDNPFYLTQPKRRSGSGALILDQDGRVLLVEPTYKPTWEIPGGIVESGEDPRTACIRECLEEIGLEIDPGRLLVLEHQIEPLPRGDSIMFVYDGGVISEPALITLPRSEIRGFRFVDEVELDTLTTLRVARRIRQSIIARQRGLFIEMVDGVPVKLAETSVG